MSEIEFHYWPIRGLGHSVQLMLEITGTKYKEVRLTSPEQWAEQKQELSKDHMMVNIPAVKKGDFYLSEHDAILHWIAVESNRQDLLGKTDMDKVKVEQLKSLGRDMFMAIVMPLFAPTYTEESWVEQLKTRLLPKLEQVNKMLESNDFLVGYLTIADIRLLCITQMLQKAKPELLEGFKNVVRHAEKSMMEVAGVKEFYESDRCQQRFLPGIAKLQI